MGSIESRMYDLRHRFDIQFPCLSFDVLRDDLGLVRSASPHTVFCVTGTQAPETESNYIGIFKLSNLSVTRHDYVPPKTDAQGSDIESDDSDSDEGDGEEGTLGAPILQLRKVFHDGVVNRIRSMSQNPHICASWVDTGYVQVWDFNSHINALAESTDAVGNGAEAASNQAPLANFKHEDEGYALDWSPLVPGRLISGDCKNFIHLWEPTSGATWNIDSNPFVGHTQSVEDLQWSPALPSVFASCSVDGTFAIWDTRLGKSPAATTKAHEADVNVISWNRLASCMLASGSDDGSFSIWDLRLLKDGDPVVANFGYHEDPITSIEWSPHEVSVLAISSSDNELTFWDLSLEKEEEDDPSDYPPQLLFVHRGQTDLKELHWHPQIPGMVISTASDSFNVIIPSTITDLFVAADD